MASTFCKRMKNTLYLLSAFVSLWGLAALAGLIGGLYGIIRNGFSDPLSSVGVLIPTLCFGIFAAISLYSSLSFWKHRDQTSAEGILSLSAFYAWVSFMMAFPFSNSGRELVANENRFNFEAFLVLASVPIIFLAYRVLQERTRRYFKTQEAEQSSSRER